MATPVFPTLTRVDPISGIENRTFEDSSLFKENIEDQSKTVSSDNGYSYSRPRYTRRARRKFTTGFTEIDNDQKQELSDFYYDRMGGSEPFIYVHPVTRENINCKFDGALDFDYIGHGETYRWSIELRLKEI